MKRPLTIASLALAATASTAFLSAPAASATTTELPGCPQTRLCVWTGSDFTGQVTRLTAGGGCVNAKEPIQSAANTWQGGGPGIPVTLDVYSGKDCTGDLLVHLSRGDSAPSLPTEGLSTSSSW
jgi:hypothetical protein